MDLRRATIQQVVQIPYVCLMSMLDDKAAFRRLHRAWGKRGNSQVRSCDGDPIQPLIPGGKSSLPMVVSG
jgi:hypothetical protein